MKNLISHKVLFGVLLSLLLNSCIDDPFKDANVKLEGEFPLLAGKTMILNEIEVYAFSPVDTIKLDNEGRFKSGINIDETGIFILKADNQNFINLVLSPGEHVKLHSDQSQLKGNYTVEGSRDSEILLQFEIEYEQKRNAIEKHSGNSVMPGGASPKTKQIKGLKALYDSLFVLHKDYVRASIESYPGSISNLVMLNRRFGQDKVFNEYQDFDVYALIDSALMAEMPDNKHTKNHHTKVESTRIRLDAKLKAAERLQPGKKAPDFTIPEINGNEISLSDLKGRPVLLYFWASTNSTSRKLNKEVVKFGHNYRQQQLKIMGISLDSYKEMWEAAIKVDKLDWIHVSDLRGQNSPAVFLYQVSDELPYMYLLDSEQKILAASDKLDEIKMAMKSLTGTY